MPISHAYCGFGLDFQSEILIPEMREGHAGFDLPVTIRLAGAPRLAGLTLIAEGVAAGPDDFWMAVPDVAHLHVHGGAIITIDPAEGAAMADVRVYMLGSAIGALLHQRGRLPLHASAVAIDGIGVAFVGASGAGKSSLALALVKRGHRLLCDDVAAIDLSGDGPVLWPGLVTLKLWADSIAAAGEQSVGLRQVLGTMDKYLRPAESLAANVGHPLGHVVLLELAHDGQPVITPLIGSGGTTALVANTFRGQLVQPMAQERVHFERCVRLANTSQLWTLSRPWAHDAMDAACALIEQAVRTS